MSDTSFAGVRIAKPSDVDTVYRMMLSLHSENGLAQLSPPKSYVAIKKLISGDDQSVRGVVGVIEGPDGSIQASVGLFLGQWWYSDEWHLEELWTYVLPEHRKSNHAKRLIEFEKWCSDDLHVPLITGILTTTRLAAKTRLYQRQLPQIGSMFCYGPQPHDDVSNQKSFQRCADDSDIGYVRA